MMNSTVKVALFVAGLMISTGLDAQRGACTRGGSGYYGEKPGKCLELTDTQSASIEAARSEFFKAKTDVFADASLTVIERREKIQQLRSEWEAAMKEILDESQYAVWLQQRNNSSVGKSGNKNRPFFGRMESFPQEVINLRMEFEQELSETERMLIAEVRENWQQNRELYGNGKGFRGAGAGKGPRTCLQPLEEIINNHEGRLAKISEELNQLFAGRCLNEGRGFRNRADHAPFRNQKQGKEDRRIFHFLLIDAQSYHNPSGMPDKDQVALFPNPATEHLSIQFSNPTDGEVTVELMDKSGNLIMVIDQSVRQAGTHTVVFNTGQLTANEVFLIRVTGPGFSVAQKFISL